MFLMRFTERAYVNYTAADVRNSPNSAVRLTFSNSHFDPQVGADLYNLHLDEYQYSEEVGFDGLMLNEHHNTPTCLGATMNLEAAILAQERRNHPHGSRPTDPPERREKGRSGPTASRGGVRSRPIGQNTPWPTVPIARCR